MWLISPPLRVLLFLSPIVFAHQVPLQDEQEADPSPFTSSFDALVKSTLDHFNVPGLSVAVVHGEETYAKGYGLAALPDVPATPETLYYAGSTTKAFTAAAVSLLTDDHANETVPLKWDTPIASLIREDFVLPDEYVTNHITLEDALSHRTGMPRHDLTYGNPGATTRDLVSNMSTLPLTAKIRTRFQYCNIMFSTVGYVVEKLSGGTLADFFRSRIWKALRMDATYFGLDDAKASGRPLAKGYNWQNAAGIHQEVPYIPILQIGGAGAVISNVLDYSKWLRALLKREPPISARGYEALATPRSIADPVSIGMQTEHVTGDILYTLGWLKYTYNSHTVFSHEGSCRGFGATIFYIPSLQWGTILFGNTQGTANSAATVLAYHLLDNLLQIPTWERYPWQQTFDNETSAAQQELATARARLYPHVPDPALPLSLPLSMYAGSYHRAAYGALNFSVHGDGDGDGVLQAETDKALLAYRITLEHVSGEYFLVSFAGLYTNETTRKSRAEFRIGADGRVGELGIELDGGLAAVGEKSWFPRVA